MSPGAARPRGVLWVGLVLGAACTAPVPRQAPSAPMPPAAVATSRPRAAPAPGPKRMIPPGRFVAGPPVRPARNLLAWLQRVGRRRVRLPVVIRFDASPLRSRRDAFVGASPRDLSSQPLRLRLDDTAMGISLRTRLRSACPQARSWCALWLEGTWGPLLRHRTAPRPAGSPHPFAVRRVVGPVKATEGTQQLRAWVSARRR